jgi:pyruvate dehydrogenase E2 component (dihydrolipoamide acetyltransferase)
MAIAVIMPKQGQSVETCIITKWFKSKGDNVAGGEILFSYETDKAAFDLESPSDGVLLEILYSEGAEVPVLANVAFIGKSGEIITEHGTGLEEVKAVVAAETVKAAETGKKEIKTGLTKGERARISPRARRMADEKGIDISSLNGSGPNGRIIAADIGKAPDLSLPGLERVVSSTAGFSEQPLSNVRKLIAKAMHASLQNSAQLTHHMSADVRRLLEARQLIKNKISSDNKQQDISLNDMICWCVIRALEKFPEANSHFLDDHIRTYNKIHLGIAVDTPRGLMVPAVKNANEMDLITLSKELKSAADSCRQGNVNPELIKSTSASFTVSNLGSYGVEMFTPVINLPQVAILGVCAIINRPASLGNNVFGFVPYIGLSLTYDHRAIDGGPATLFLREIKEQIEKFSYQILTL